MPEFRELTLLDDRACAFMRQQESAIREEAGLPPGEADLETLQYWLSQKDVQVFLAEECGQIVGFGVYDFYADHPQYRVSTSYQRTLYILPEYRQYLLDFMDFIYSRLKCELLLAASPVSNPGFAGLLTVTGHTATETIYTKVLKHGRG